MLKIRGGLLVELLILLFSMMLFSQIVSAEVCYDSDGDNAYSIGFWTSGYNDLRSEVCVNNVTVQEFYCVGADYAYHNLLCLNGCVGGKCNAANITCGDGVCHAGEDQSSCSVDCAPYSECVDTDGGLNYFTTGRSSLTYSYQWINDSCSDSRYLTEYYCMYYTLIDGSNPYSRSNTVTVECPNGCHDGRCDPVTNTSSCGDGKCYGAWEDTVNCPLDCGSSPDLCYDPDGGNDLLRATTVRDTSRQPDSGLLNELLSDYCFNNNTIVEYNCLSPESPRRSGLMRGDSIKYDCPNGCKDGACIPPIDDLYCGDLSCNNGENCLSCSEDCNTCFVPRCGDGFCSYSEDPDICSSDCDWAHGKDFPGCYDYDGGLDIFEKAFLGFEQRSYQDYCYNQNFLVEYSCSSSSENLKMIWCPYQCSDGKCIDQSEQGYCGDNICNNGETCNTCSQDCGYICNQNFCTDSDGGYNLNQSGTTIGNQESYLLSIRSDFCSNGNVYEYTCDANNMTLPIYSICEGGCASGACLPLGRNYSVCGDSVCESNESCSSCSSDCGTCKSGQINETASFQLLNPSGPGSHFDWDNMGCVLGASEWQCVAAQGGGVLYTNARINIKETMNFENVSFIDRQIESVTLHYRARNSGFIYETCFYPILVESQIDYRGTPNICPPNTSFSNHQSDAYLARPSGSNWTIDAINSLEAGMEIGSNPSGISMDHVYAEVIYKPDTSNTICGDMVCDTSESCSSCASDCGQCVPSSVIIRPNGMGKSNGWINVGCPSSNEHQCVDEIIPDTSDYLYAVAYYKESFTFTDLTSSYANISSFTLNYYAKKYVNQTTGCFKGYYALNNYNISTQQVCASDVWSYYNITVDSLPDQYSMGRALDHFFINNLSAGIMIDDNKSAVQVAQMFVTVNTKSQSICGDAICNGHDSCSNCQSDCGTCPAKIAQANLAYVVGTGGFKIINVTNPLIPKLAGSFNLTNKSTIMRDIKVVGNTAYLIGNRMFAIADVADPKNPNKLAEFVLPGTGSGVHIEANYAYVAIQELGLYIYDISNLNSITLTGSYTACPNNIDVVVRDNYAFISCNEQDKFLKVINVSSKTSPTFIARGFSSGTTPQRLALKDNYAFLITLYGGVTKFNITNIKGISSLPLDSWYPLLGTYNSQGYLYDISIRDSFAFLAGSSGLEILDIANTTLGQTKKASVATPGFARSVEVFGNYAFIADEWNGLQIIDILNMSKPFLVSNVPYNMAMNLVISGNVQDQNPSPCSNGNCNPIVTVPSIPQYISKSTLLSANVSAVFGLAQTCEICISTNASCSDWSGGNVQNIFTTGASSGICSFYLNNSIYQDGNYSLNFRVADLNGNIGQGITKYVILDQTMPSIFQLKFEGSLQTNSLVTVYANISDSIGVKNASVYFGSAGISQMIKESSGLYKSSISTPLSAGSTNLLIEAYDLAGNKASIYQAIIINQKIEWSDKLQLTNLESDEDSPAISEDSLGNLNMVWADSRFGSPEIYYSKLSGTGKLLIYDKRISDSIYNSLQPSIKSYSGNSYIVWQDDRDANQEIYFSALDSSGNILSGEKRVTFSASASSDPILLAGESGISLFWIESKSAIKELNFKRINEQGNNIINNKVITSNILGYSAAEDSSYVYVAYQDPDSKIVLSKLDANGNNIQSAVLAQTGKTPKLAVSKNGNVNLAYLNSANDLIYLLVKNFTVSASKNISSQISTLGMEITSDSSNAVHLVWIDKNGNLAYTKLDDEANYLVSPSMLMSGTNIKNPSIAAGSIHILYQEQNVSDDLFIKTTLADKTAPVISSVLVTEITGDTATISWITDEPGTSSVHYGISSSLGQSASSSAFKSEHSITITNLKPQTSYYFAVESSDLFGNAGIDNNHGFGYQFATKYLNFVPVLPTSLYGQVVNENNNSAIEGIEVTASWLDPGNNLKQTKTVTLTKVQADALNDSSLAGYFLFNEGKVRAKPDSKITVSAPGDITAPDPFVFANPGGDALQVIGGPIKLDVAPPDITIDEPKEITYPMTELKLRYFVNENISSASFVLNDQSPVIITGMQNKNISLTAKLGVNTLSVTAVDLIGLSSTKSVAFTVQDLVPPSVSVNSPVKVSKSAVLSANVSDATNSLKQSCEVCISSDNVCDTEWTSGGVQNQFSDGDFAGLCSYQFDSSPYASGQFLLNFRVKDAASNIGTGNPIFFEVDNLAPAKILNLSVVQVPKENSLLLSWQPVTAYDFHHYLVFRSSAPFSDIDEASQIKLLPRITNTSFKDSGLVSMQTYYYAVTVVDDANNQDRKPIVFSGTVADTAKPVITIVSPKDQSTIQKTFNLTISANEQTNWCVYNLNNRANSSVVPGSSFIADEGENVLGVYCSDMNHNVGEARVNFYVNSISPSPITSLQVAPISQKNELSLSWLASPAIDLFYYNVYRSEKSFTSISEADMLASVSVPNYVDTNLVSGKTYYYAVTAVDSYYNENLSVIPASAIVADTIPPIVSLISPINQLYNSKNISLSYSVNENGSVCYYNINNGQSQIASQNIKVFANEGANSISLSCNDLSGNSAVASATFNIDAETPLQTSGVNITPVKSEGSLLLSWHPSNAPDLSYYNIYRSNAQMLSLDGLAPLTKTSELSFKDTNLDSESVWYYAVSAVDLYGNENKLVISKQGKVADIIPPVPVQDVLVSSVPGENALIVSWQSSDAEDFSHYNIYRSSSPKELIKTIYEKDTASFEDINLIDGKTYKYSISVVDQNGNENVNIPEIEGTAADLKAPAITILSPMNNTYRVKSLSLSYYADEPVVDCTYTLNNGQPLLASDLITGTEGYNTIAVSCSDSAGNTGTASAGFTIDSIAPDPLDIPIVNPVPASAGLNITWIKSTAQDFSFYKIYRATTDYSDVSALDPIKTIISTNYFDPTAITGTTYYYAVTAVDLIGNENKIIQTAQVLAADTISPIITVLSPTNKDYNTQSIILTYSADEQVSSCQYSINNGSILPVGSTISASEGVNSLRVSCIDLSGNEGSSGNVAFFVDSTAPLAVQSLSVVPVQKFEQLNISWQQSSASDINEYRIYRSSSSFNDVSQMSPIATTLSTKYDDKEVVSEQTYYYAVTAVDLMDNEEKQVISISATVADTIPPLEIVGLQVAEVPNQASLQLTWLPSSASDLRAYKIYRSTAVFSDVSQMSLLLELSQTDYKDSGLASSGIYYYAVVAVDSSGNQNNRVLSVQGKVADIINPNISITSPINKKYNINSITVQYQASEAIVNCRFSLNNGPYQQLINPIAAIEGQNSIKVSCSDMAGNSGESSPISFVIDTTAPSKVSGLKVSAVPGIAKVNASWISSSEPDFSFYKIYRATAPFQDVSQMSPIATSTVPYFVDSYVSSEQTYYYTVTSVDNVGNEEKAVESAAVSIGDIIVPIITLVSPQSIRYSASNVTLAYLANENASWCTYSLNNLPNISATTNMLIIAREGQNILKLYCADNAQNIGFASVNFEVDVFAPSQVIGLQVLPVEHEGSLQLSWQASQESDFSQYKIYRSSSSFNNVVGMQSILQTSANSYKDTDLVSEAIYYYAVTAIDKFYNENKTVVSKGAKVADIIPPDAVQGLNVAVLQNEVGLLLSWDPSNASDIDHYNIYRSDSIFDDASSLQSIDSTSDSSYLDNNILEGHSYFYGITPVDKSNNENTYVIAVNGTALDITPPEISVIDVGEKVAGRIILSAIVADSGSGLKKKCEICISLDQNCDSDWTEQSVVTDFVDGSANGLCSYEWDTSPLDRTVYIYNFRISDLQENSREGAAKLTEIINTSSLLTFDIALEQGWNLISLPLMPVDQSVAGALNSLGTNYKKIIYYDPNSQDWMFYNPKRSFFDPPNNLLQIEIGKSYWIDMSAPAILAINGYESTNLSIALVPDWNFVGYPLLSEKNITEVMAGIDGKFNRIYSYDAKSQNWNIYHPYASAFEPNTLLIMRPGQGYLIDMRDSAQWQP